MADDRRAIHVFVSEDAHDGLRLFAQAHGVTVAGFLEALGVALHDVDKPPPLLRDVLAEARIIDAERRERGR
jgi:hypothetical protein